MSVKKFVILDSSNIIIDTMMWDGNTETWTPPSDMIYKEVPTSDRVSIGMTYNKDGLGTGTEATNMWIIPDDQTLDGSNWDKNGKGDEDMYE